MFIGTSCYKAEKEELEVKLSEKVSELAKLRIEKLDLENEFRNFSNKTTIEKDSLERQLSILTGRIEELQTELTDLRNSSFDPSDQNYINGLTNRIDELEEKLLEEQRKKATLENTIVKLQIEYKTKSQEYVQKASQTLITVYESLLEINDIKSNITEDLSKYKGGARRIDMAESIKTNLGQISQKINDTKEFLQNGYATEDSLQQLKNLYVTLIEKVDIYKNDISTLTNQVQDLVAQIEELNKGYYLVKPKRVLENLGIIKSRFLRSPIYQAENIELEDCKIADKTANYLTIPHNADEDVSIFSPHQPNSYTIINESPTVTRIDIRNPKLFWNSSNFLVIGLE
jgi:chromosome segregation ATPase